MGPLKFIQKWTDISVQYLFYTRNSFFQLLYLFLVSTFHSAVIYDGLAILRLHDPKSYHLPIPLIICTINVITFLIASYADPGVITRKNIKYHVGLYKYDGIIFKPNEVCPTCKLVKPARSKHCKITQQCIYKFDHYCVWIRNAIGGNNHRYFLLLLFTLAIMLINGLYNIGKVLEALTHAFKLWELAEYKVTKLGVKCLLPWLPIVTDVHLAYFQILFHRFPRVVFIGISCLIFSAIELYFLIYHITSVLKNETTNESYKRYQHHKSIENCSKLSKISIDIHPVNNVYYKSIWKNILDELFPPNENIKQS